MSEISPADAIRLAREAGRGQDWREVGEGVRWRARRGTPLTVRIAVREAPDTGTAPSEQQAGDHCLEAVQYLARSQSCASSARVTGFGKTRTNLKQTTYMPHRVTVYQSTHTHGMHAARGLRTPLCTGIRETADRAERPLERATHTATPGRYTPHRATTSLETPKHQTREGASSLPSKQQRPSLKACPSTG